MFNRRPGEQAGVGGADYAEVMDWLSRESRVAYRELIEAPGFMTYYRQATPIDALEHGCFGSRPARRTGSATLDDLRAIPWVFSWTQARFYLPGWYGVGSALKKLKQEDETQFAELCRMVAEEPFLRYLLTNVETNLASADPKLMGDYSSLVEDREIRERFHQLIAAEFSLTETMISEVFGSPMGERRPRMLRTLQMREFSLYLLHQQQIGLLSEWRQAMQVNAIASGLRTTG